MNNLIQPSTGNIPAVESCELQKNNKTQQLDKTASDTIVALISSTTITDAAEKLHINRSTLYRRIERYGLQKIIDDIPKQAIDNLKMLSLAASQALGKGLSSSRNSIVAACEILDRVGVAKVNINNTPNVAIQINNLVNEDREKYT